MRYGGHDGLMNRGWYRNTISTIINAEGGTRCNAADNSATCTGHLWFKTTAKSTVTCCVIVVGIGSSRLVRSKDGGRIQHFAS